MVFPLVDKDMQNKYNYSFDHYNPSDLQINASTVKYSVPNRILQIDLS
jgi:hypothetical protein